MMMCIHPKLHVSTVQSVNDMYNVLYMSTQGLTLCNVAISHNKPEIETNRIIQEK